MSTQGSPTVVATISDASLVRCRVLDCTVPKGYYVFTDDDLIFNIQLRHRKDGQKEWHRNGIRLSSMLRRAAARPEVLNKVLQKTGIRV